MRLTPDESGRFVDLDGRSLYVHMDGPTGAAAPLMVLIHGAGHAAVVWGPLAAHFAGCGWSVMSIDLPGHGRSGGETVDTIESLATLVAGLIEAAAHERTTIVGHSMGGLVALELAARRPELVDRLVVVGAGAALPVNALLLDAAQDDGAPAIQLFDRWAHSRTVDEAVRATTRSLLEGLDEGVLHTSLVACDRYARGAESALAITAPVLVVTGEHDVMVDRSEVARLELALQDVTAMVIADAGHNIIADRPEALIAAIERFLDAQESSG